MAEKFLNINGELKPYGEANIDINNRAFRYGDGLFETIKIIDGKPVALEAHLDRLFKGMDVLYLNKPTDYSFNGFTHRIKELLEANDIQFGGRLRLSVFRANGGYYTPQSFEPVYTMEADRDDTNGYLLNDTGLTIDLYPDMKKPVTKLSTFKTANGLINIMAALYAKDKGWDDALLQNDKLGIIESSSSNLFIVSNGVLYTPGLEAGCVGGTMRMQLINLAVEHKIQVYESNITPQNLLVADELFLTNAISGIRWVSCYKTKRYFNSMSTKLIGLLNDSVN